MPKMPTAGVRWPKTTHFRGTASVRQLVKPISLEIGTCKSWTKSGARDQVVDPPAYRERCLAQLPTHERAGTLPKSRFEALNGCSAPKHVAKQPDCVGQSGR
jgi:hypothetical protein